MRERVEGNRWAILALLFFARLIFAFQFQSLAALGPLLTRSDGGLSQSTFGTLVGIYMLPGIVLAFPGGLLGQRFGDKAVCMVALALMMTGGTLVAESVSVPGIALGRIICGIGAVFLSIVLAKMLTDWFARRETV